MTRTVAILAALLVVAPAPAQAEDGPDPSLFAEPKANSTPTPYACTVETLYRGEDCVFESDAALGDSSSQRGRENAAAAAELALGACARAARAPHEATPDRDLAKLCQDDFKQAAQDCAREDRRPLLDSGGRFSPGARSCYFAMGEVLRKVHAMSAVATPCCRCIAAKGCLKGTAEQCLRALSGVKVGLPECGEKACADACSPLLPHQPEPASEERPAPDRAAPDRAARPAVQKL